MERFDRITPQRDDKPGQAFIRDTDITVSEVVKLVVGGQRVNAVLAQYDELDIEDVHQALAYAVYDLKNLTGAWRSETLAVLTAVTGYADIIYRNAKEREEIIVLESKPTISLEQSAHTILMNSKRTMSHWDFLIYQADLYSPPNLELGKHHFSKLISYINKRCHFYDDKVTVTFEFPDNLPAIKYDRSMEYAILLLVAYNSYAGIFIPSSRVHAKQISPTQVRISIIREIKSEIHSTRIADAIKFWFIRGMPHSIAFRTIRTHGTELHYDIHDDGVTFSFKLPIWKDDET